MVSKKEKKAFFDAVRLKFLELEMEIKNDVSVPIVASFGFIIALVWRDAIKAAVDEFLIRSGLVGQAYVYNFLSAIVVTIVVIVIMVFVTRFARGRKTEKLQEKVDHIAQRFPE